MFSMMSNDIGIDLGTASILVYIKGKGVVLKEPSVVAIDRDTNKIMAIGEEARLMIGRTPGNIVAVRPLRQGVISDYTITEKMLKYFISKAVGKKTLRKPRISVCIPSGATEVEKKAVEDATYQAGAREVAIIEEPVAAAIGAGIDIGKACGNMIVDIGGGTTGLALLKDGKVVEIADEPTGGTHLTLVLSGNYHIPFAEAEAIKQDYSRHREILPILKPVIEKMATIVKKNIVSKNVDTIYLCGGTCCLTGMEKIIEKETGIPTIKPADPFLVTPTGIAMNCKV